MSLNSSLGFNFLCCFYFKSIWYSELQLLASAIATMMILWWDSLFDLTYYYKASALPLAQGFWLVTPDPLPLWVGSWNKTIHSEDSRAAFNKIGTEGEEIHCLKEGGLVADVSRESIWRDTAMLATAMDTKLKELDPFTDVEEDENEKKTSYTMLILYTVCLFWYCHWVARLVSRAHILLEY